MSPSLTDRVGNFTRAHASPTLLRGHTGRLAHVAFLSDNQIVSASDEDKTVRQWSLSDKHDTILLRLPLCAVATSPDGRWVAIGYKDGKIKLFDFAKPREMKSAARHTGEIRTLSFSPDSSQLASGSQDMTMYVSSLPALDQIAGPLKGYKDAIWCVSYSPDGKHVASCDREVIRIWDCTTWTGVAITEKAWSLAWSVDGNTLFAGCIDGKIKCYSPSTCLLLSTCNGHGDAVFSIAVSHNAKFIATASWDKTVRIWDASTLQEIGQGLSHDAKVHSISISPDDIHLVTGARDSNIRVWDLKAIAPALFGTYPIEQPERRTQQRKNSLGFAISHWIGTTKDSRSPDAPSSKDPRRLDFHDETLENSDRSSTTSKSSKKNLIKSVSFVNVDQSDTGSSAAASHTDVSQKDKNWRKSDSSIKRPVEEPLVMPPLEERRDATINKPRSPTQSRGPIKESENAGFVREIRSDPSHDLTKSIVAEDSNPVSGGTHGDVYRGNLHVNGKTMRVAIKVIKKYTNQGDNESKKRRLRREIKLWLTLDHKNVIPLLGTTTAYGEFPAMVCPWVENGALTSYLDCHDKEMSTQWRFGIINDVALGLQYLHLKSIVHGDMSGSNVLIYASGRACIADFGLSMVVTEIEGSSVALTYQPRGTLRYTAPELFNVPGTEEEDDARVIFPTLQSDIYSFGGIMLQVLSGKIPFHYLARDQQVLLTIAKGERPRRPAASVVTDDQWAFMMDCWSTEPTERPVAECMVDFVHEQLLKAVASSSSSARS